jgi:8-oxo-dGTP diphosphatase
MPRERKPAEEGAQGASQRAPEWPRCAASAAIFRGSTVLLVQRGKGALQGLWSLPGGHIEPGETARAAAVREVREETGVAVELAGLVDVHDVIVRAADGALVAHYLIAVFCGRWLAGEPVPGADEIAARFVPLEDIDAAGRYRLTDGTAAFIHRSLAQLHAAGPPQ